MRDGLRAAWRGLRHLQNRGYVYIWANVFWAVLTLLIVTAPAAFAGMARLSHRLHRHPSASLDEFWTGVREHILRSIPIAVANVALVYVTLSNLLHYAQMPGFGFTLLRGWWIVMLVAWFVLQYFAWCFYYAMERPSYRGAARNALVMIIHNPGFTLSILLVAGVVVLISTLLPAAWFLIAAAALVSMASSAVLDRLRAAGIERTPLLDESLIVDAAFNDS